MASYTGDSIVDYLKSIGQDSSMTARKKLAQELGITNYTGSGTQNTQLLNTLRSGATSSNTSNNVVAKNEDVKGEVIGGDGGSNAPAEFVPNSREKKDKLLGVDEETYAKTQKEFEASDEVKEWDEKKSNALSDLGDLIDEDIISDDVMNSLNSSFNVPSEVLEADRYLAEQLEVIQSGKTSYSDQVRDMINQIMNREKFSYDVDKDPLFQQALASAMNSGKQAMQDTIGQASALTGGYGSTYATTAGNQAYNAFIEDAYDNLPQYYQMALEAYQAEGDEMYRQYSMLSTEDEKEFNRNVTAYDATYQHRNRMYDEAYGAYRDNKSDAFAMANLQITEHGQRVSDAYNYYGATADYADTLYEREYNSWADSINMAWKEVEALNTEAWANKNFDEGVRQYETTLAEQKRQYDTSFAEEQRQFNETMAFNQAKAASSSGGGGGGGGSYGSGNYKLSTTEINGLSEAYKKGGIDGAWAYLNGIGKAPTEDYSVAVVEDLLFQVEAEIEAENTEKEAEKKANTPKSGTVSEFRSVEGDNFTVKVGDKTYGVENHGKVTDNTTLKALNKLNTQNDNAFLYNGDVYVKSGGGYYKVGAKLFGSKNYESLRKALQK